MLTHLITYQKLTKPTTSSKPILSCTTTDTKVNNTPMMMNTILRKPRKHGKNLYVIYSHGNTAYNGAPEAEKTYTWTSSDLFIPSGASVVSARLYQGYTYNKMGVDPAWTLVFNGNTLVDPTTYSDIKGFGSYSNPYGLYVYDVTSFFDAAGNTMTITPEEGVNYGIYGAYLVVVYEDSTTSYKQIFINDGFDMLYSRDSYSVNDTEATAYANFEDVYTTGLENAKTIVVMGSSGPSSADENKSKFLFNGVEYTGFWNDYLTSPQIGFSVYDVTSSIVEGFNTAGMQSYDPTGPGDSTYGDNMYTMTTILVTDYGAVVDEPPEVIAVDPADTTTDVDQDQQITVTFNENIQAGTNYNGITVRTLSGQGYSITKNIVDDQLFITGKWTPGTTFQIVIPKNSVQDLNGNQITDTFTATFTASEGPSVTSFDPTDGATNVDPNKQIVVTFSENIQAGTTTKE
jgi:methionine-rich copper-binding protein CopC